MSHRRHGAHHFPSNILVDCIFFVIIGSVHTGPGSAFDKFHSRTNTTATVDRIVWCAADPFAVVLLAVSGSVVDRNMK